MTEWSVNELGFPVPIGPEADKAKAEIGELRQKLGLHPLGLHIRTMTPDRFRECLRALDWSQRGLASLLDVNERQVRRWASGDYEAPHSIALWLETLAAFHEKNPPPNR